MIQAFNKIVLGLVFLAGGLQNDLWVIGNQKRVSRHYLAVRIWLAVLGLPCVESRVVVTMRRIHFFTVAPNSLDGFALIGVYNLLPCGFHLHDSFGDTRKNRLLVLIEIVDGYFFLLVFCRHGPVIRE